MGSIEDLVSCGYWAEKESDRGGLIFSSYGRGTWHGEGLNVEHESNALIQRNVFGIASYKSLGCQILLPVTNNDIQPLFVPQHVNTRWTWDKIVTAWSRIERLPFTDGTTVGGNWGNTIE